MIPEPGTRPRAFDRRALLVTAAAADAATVVAAPSAASASVLHSAAPAQGVPVSAANPALGPNVYEFTPAMSAASIQSTLDAAYCAQASNQFGARRYAFLFPPGTTTSSSRPCGRTRSAPAGAGPPRPAPRSRSPRSTSPPRPTPPRP